MRISRVLVSVVALTIATSALAQDVSEDWEVSHDPRTKTVFAFIPTTSGLTIGFRCVDGSYGAIIGGLPEAPRNMQVRTLGITTKDRNRSSRWTVTTDRTAVVADYPAQLARQLREGGNVSILIPGGADGGRNLRHDLVLPASSSAIDETLTACNRPTDDPRDDLLPAIGENGLPSGMIWSRAPTPRFPRNNYAQGLAVVTCVVTPTGGLNECEVESEFPTDGRFGSAALTAAREATVNSPGETRGQYAPRLIGFRVNFRMP